MNHFFIKSCLASFCLAFLWALPVSALTLSPARRVMTIDQNTAREILVRVENDEAQSIRLEASVSGVKQDVSGRPVFGKGFDDAENWVKPKNSIIEIAPGKIVELPFVVRVPEGAFPGAHWLALTVENRSEDGGQTILNKRLVSLLSLQVAGIVTESLDVETTLARHSVFGGQALPLTLRIVNTGTIEVPLQGKNTLLSLGGRKLAEKIFSPGNQLLPRAERMTKYTIIPGKTCLSETVFCTKLAWPGLYRLETTIIYGKTGQVSTHQESFWFFPLWSLGALGVIVVVGGVVVWRIRRARMIQKYGATQR